MLKTPEQLLSAFHGRRCTMCLFLAFDVKTFCNEIYIYYLSLFVILTCDYLLIVGAEGYCCT